MSVVGPRVGYTYDMYTAIEHTVNDFSTDYLDEKRLAVGITQSAVWADQGFSSMKSEREKYFPLELIDCGVSFKCEEGAASVDADKDKILSEIGNQKTVLDEQIHAVVGGAALERVLKENDERRHQYLEAVRKGGPPRQLYVYLRGSKADCQATVTALIDALGASDQASRCEELVLRTNKATELPESLGRLTGLKTLTLLGCDRLKSLPNSMSQMVALETLKLSDCCYLRSLPDSISQWVALKYLDLSDCKRLVGNVELRSGVEVKGRTVDNYFSSNTTRSQIGLARVRDCQRIYNHLTITYVSEEEIARKAAFRLEAQVRFHSIDTNGDGTLDASELSATLCDSGLTDNEIEALFFKLDSNSDNQVSALLAICC